MPFDRCSLDGRAEDGMLRERFENIVHHINSAGGYLRDLTRRAEKGEFSLGPILMALMRANAPVGRKAG